VLVIAASGDLETVPQSAARAFAGFPFNDGEIAAAAHAGYFEAAGRYVPKLLTVLQQAVGSEDPASDAAVLFAIQAPVVVLLGSDTKPFFTTSARYVTEHESRYVTDPVRAHPGRFGYLLKDRVVDVQVLVQALRTIVAGGTVLDPDVIAHLLGRNDLADQLARLSGLPRA